MGNNTSSSHPNPSSLNHPNHQASNTYPPPKRAWVRKMASMSIFTHKEYIVMKKFGLLHNHRLSALTIYIDRFPKSTFTKLMKPSLRTCELLLEEPKNFRKYRTLLKRRRFLNTLKLDGSCCWTVPLSQLLRLIPKQTRISELSIINFPIQTKEKPNALKNMPKFRVKTLKYVQSNNNIQREILETLLKFFPCVQVLETNPLYPGTEATYYKQLQTILDKERDIRELSLKITINIGDITDFGTLMLPQYKHLSNTPLICVKVNSFESALIQIVDYVHKYSKKSPQEKDKVDNKHTTQHKFLKENSLSEEITYIGLDITNLNDDPKSFPTSTKAENVFSLFKPITKLKVTFQNPNSLTIIKALLKGLVKASCYRELQLYFNFASVVPDEQLIELIDYIQPFYNKVKSIGFNMNLLSHLTSHISSLIKKFTLLEDGKFSGIHIPDLTSLVPVIGGLKLRKLELSLITRFSKGEVEILNSLSELQPLEELTFHLGVGLMKDFKREDNLMMEAILKFITMQKRLKKLQLSLSELRISSEKLRELFERISKIYYLEELVLGVGLAATSETKLAHDVIFLPYLVKSDIRISKAFY